MMAFKLDFSRESHIYYYDFVWNGSRLFFIVVWNKYGIWGIIEICCLKVCNPIFNASHPPSKYLD